MNKSKPGEAAMLAEGFPSDKDCLSSANNQRQEKRRRSDVARVFEPKESTINCLFFADRNFQAVYDVCAVHVVLFVVAKVLFDSLAAGRLSVDLHLFHTATGYCNFTGIAAFVLTELVLLSMAVSVHPALMVWKLIHTRFPLIQVDAAFFLIYLLGIASSFLVVLWAVFTIPLGSVFSITLTFEQVRLVMKTYSYVCETAKKVFTPWNKDDTTGPAVKYAGQMEPKVGSMANYLYFLFVPTLLYRDRYPRNEGPINWSNVLAYLIQCIATLLTFVVIYQDVVVPPSLSYTHVVTSLMYSCAAGFVITLLINVGIFHSWMNLHAELLRFADRQFYDDWWTANSYAVFYRKWNAIVHDWIHAYIYTDARNAMKAYGYGSTIPALLTILVSAVIHDYVMGVGMGFCFPLVSVLFGIIGAFVYVVRPCVMKRASNTFLLSSLGVGVGLLAFCYMLEYSSRHYYCPREDQFSDFFFSSRFLQCYGNFN